MPFADVRAYANLGLCPIVCRNGLPMRWLAEVLITNSRLLIRLIWLFSGRGEKSKEWYVYWSGSLGPRNYSTSLVATGFPLCDIFNDAKTEGNVTCGTLRVWGGKDHLSAVHVFYFLLLHGIWSLNQSPRKRYAEWDSNPRKHSLIRTWV